MNKEVIYEYELLLLEKTKTFPPYYFRFSDSQNEKIALSIFRYAFDTYLGWTPEQLRYNLTYDIVVQLKLSSFIKYIDYPPEADRTKDMYPIIAKLYPGKFKETTRDVVNRVYNKVMSGERDKFPKEFFSGAEGRYKAILCFQRMLNGMPPINDVQELYKAFSGASGVALLRKHKLYAVSTGIFEYPIDFLHASLPKELRSDYYYNYYRFYMKSKRRIILED